MLSAAQMAQMSRLLETALELDAVGRRSWLEALAPEYENLLPALRRALLPDGDEASCSEELPNIAAAIQSGSIGPSSDEAPPDETVLVGQTLGGRYRLERTIGEGGVGRVYFARDEQVEGETFAIKVLKSGLRANALALLREEVHKTRRLSHPNIVDVHSLNSDGRRLYVLMEYLEGKPLNVLLDEEFGRGMPLSRAWPIIEDVGAALACAHDHGVIHSDLKPANIFVTTSGRTKLLDFGIARASRGQAGKSGIHALTPAYASCEMLEGKRAHRRDDIYSFACVIYEILSAERPFGELNALEAREAGARPAPLGVLSREQNSALHRALAFEGDVRTNSVEELLSGLAPEMKRRASPIPERSIAVLPFVDLSAQRDQEYFSDGLAEELIDLLTQVQELRVPARTSSFYFKGKSEPILTIAHTLGVAHVLEGSVRKAGNRVRVTAHLIRADNGYHLWSKTFDREVENVFIVQDQIAAAVVQALKAQLLPNQQVINHHRTDSADAYDQYLRAKRLSNLRTVDSLHRAIEALQQTIILDPKYAPAYVTLAMTRFALVEQGATRDPTDAETAFAAANSAVELAPGLAEAYSARGYVRLRVRWDWTGAAADLNRAIQLDPRHSATQSTYAFMLGTLGRYPEAVEAAERAIEINPLDPWSWTILGICLEGAGNNAAATRAFNHALEVSPEGATSIANLVVVELAQGHVQEARKANSRQRNEAWRWMGDAMIEHASGYAKKSQDALDALIGKYGRIIPYVVAGVYASCGQKDKAFEWLDRAFDQRDVNLCMIKLHAPGVALKNDPRYQAFLRKIKLPE